MRLLWDLSETLASVLALALNGAQAKDAAKVGRDGLHDDRLFWIGLLGGEVGAALILQGLETKKAP